MVNGKKIACTSCKRVFKTTAAMQQHRQAAHQTGQSRPAGVRSGQKRAPNKVGAPIVLSGSDIFVMTSVQSGAFLGTSLGTHRLSPRDISSSRLAQMSQMWARWRPKTLTLKVVCSGAFTTFGSIAIGWSPDPTYELTGIGQGNLGRVLASKPSAIFRLSQGGVLRVPCDSSRKWYLTSGQADDTCHGAVTVVVGAVTGGYSGSVSVSVMLDWSIEFEGAELESAETSDVTIAPDAGWINLFTTSDSSFDSSILTFKMHHGGSMVPWSSAHPATVYTVSPGTTVPYYTEQKTVVNCSYFARIQSGYAVPGMLMFISAADAKEYIRSGDLAKAVKYYSQGPECTPGVPKLQPMAVSTANPLAEMAGLRAEIAQLRSMFEGPTSSVMDTGVRSALRQVNDSLDARPAGTLSDPINVFVEDPVRSPSISARCYETLARYRRNSGGAEVDPPLPSESE